MTKTDRSLQVTAKKVRDFKIKGLIKSDKNGFMGYFFTMDTQVLYEATPNPHSMKFIVNQDIATESFEVKDRTKATRSPLAAKILGFPWAKSVFIGQNFVTITKEDWLDWDSLQKPIAEMIAEHIQRGEKVLLPEASKQNTAQQGENSSEEDSPVIKQIKDILDKEIQPAVAMDGGFIEFVSYKNQTVYLSLQGACAGCPSSSYTLKEGIQTRLQQSIPEIKEVVSV